MKGPAPGLVVTLPARSPVGARSEMELARLGGADLVEIRFDRWDSESQGHVGELFPAPLPLVAALRSRSEGGEGPDDPTTRASILLALARFPFRWIDLETQRDLGLLDRLPPAHQLGRILSTHHPDGVDPETWQRELTQPVGPGTVRKVVARATIGELCSTLLPGIPQPVPEPLAVMTTGPSGPLLRTAARRLGLPLVYAAMPRGTNPDGSSVEPSQIPVDELRRYLLDDGAPPLFGLAGHPVAHSRSPRLHARWMSGSGRTGLYVPLDFQTENELVGTLPDLVEWGFRGVNVTHPWKVAAVQLATEVSGGAATCGVANTLTFRGTAIEAEDTDLLAMVGRLEELRDSGRWPGDSLAVVGSGGAARATLAAAREVGCRAAVYARRRQVAETLAQRFDADVGDAADPRAASLVVHATPVGRPGCGPLSVDLGSLLGPGTHLLDWVYDAEVPTIRNLAESAGATYEDGRRLLVFQAAASFEIWWGEPLTPELVNEALREEGCTA
jgi:shikimate dehydrogenase